MYQRVLQTIQLQGRAVDVLRLDSCTPGGMGNKYFKMKYNIDEAIKQNHNTLLSFGGAFSNHIQALALIGSQLNLQTIGVIRGEDDPDNPTLRFAREHGMRLHFVSREAYRGKQTPNFVATLSQLFGRFYLIPEGGSNALAVRGCMEIMHGMESEYNHVLVACGTGATLAGIAATPGLIAKVTGISVLKGEDQLTQTVTDLIPHNIVPAPWSILFDCHLGGYAKNSPELVACRNMLENVQDLPTDPVYTAKVFCAAAKLIAIGQIQADEKILIVHTGGLQGLEGWNYRFPNK